MWIKCKVYIVAAFPQFTLYVDKVQGVYSCCMLLWVSVTLHLTVQIADAFAGPSRMHVKVPQSAAKYPPALFSSKVRPLGPGFLMLKTINLPALGSVAKGLMLP